MRVTRGFKFDPFTGVTVRTQNSLSRDTTHETRLSGDTHSRHTQMNPFTKSNSFLSDFREQPRLGHVLWVYFEDVLCPGFCMWYLRDVVCVMSSLQSVYILMKAD